MTRVRSLCTARLLRNLIFSLWVMGWLFFPMAAWTAGDPELTVDLTRCRVGEIPFDNALKKDSHGNFSREAEQLLTLTPLHGVHFGMCSAGSQHGQAMLVKLVAPAATTRDSDVPQVIPPLAYGMSKKTIQTLFGPPDILHEGQPYRSLLLSGNRRGSMGQWAGLCPGFTVQFTFDDEVGLTRLLVLPMDVGEPEPASTVTLPNRE
jgi:hypothetical protein